MEMRPATTDDFADIKAVAHAAWTAAYADALAGETISRTVDEWYSEASLQRILDQPETDFLVADNGGVVGFCHGVGHDGEGDIVRLYTHPDRWDEGIGYRLYERLRDDMRDSNVPEMKAIVVESDEMARTLFTRMGFTESGSGSVKMGDETVGEIVYSRAI
ncbi:GNAT family N-acetyltransferase [Haladaptatus sp. DJG-WS-42]|uniref:GNAT family N-acetyltransferase n=1 Tax=Haladaptatus sp. DJG-WS-42 TaxID=3120516 RepID=UPI0030D5D6B7